MAETRRGFTRLDLWSLLALGLFTAVVLAGFGSFGRHPELLARFPSSRGFYATAFEVFARGHVVLAFVVLAVLLVQRVGLRWVPALVVAGALSLGMELLGTATGFPFGEYRYTELLGHRLGGLVPVLIPFSWFMMGFPSYVLARRMVRGRLSRPALGAALLTIWDLTLDPAMSALTPYWVWFATGALIMVAFDAVGADAVADRIPAGPMEAYYATVLALSLAMTLIAGYWLAAILTVAVLATIREGTTRWAARAR